jgi:transcriptional regulator with PAS, ATPase and Fis domain
LLFGAKKGAYSGANADASGYVQAADGGTLFLDELGELDLNVQAKLLRFLETREVMPVGASKAQRIDVRVCSATHRDLRRAVRDGTFREDLYYRMARPQVHIPPLRDRMEDIPHLVDRKLREIDSRLIAHVSFIEACLLRPWPGNIRELTMEVRNSAAALLAEGGHLLRRQHLSETAGVAATEPLEQAPSLGAPREADLQRDAVVAALEKSEGRVATAARELGVHRNQLRRWLEKHGIDPKGKGGTPSS